MKQHKKMIHINTTIR